MKRSSRAAIMTSEESVTDTVNIRLRGASITAAYKSGDTILEAARRASLYPPFRCRMGNCGTCKAHIDSGRAEMRHNYHLTFLDIKDGWVLTCQARPTSQTISVNYDARRLLPGSRFLLRVISSSPIARWMLFFKSRDDTKD